MTATPGSAGQPVSTPGNCGRELRESSCVLPSGEPITQLNMQTALSLSAEVCSYTDLRWALVSAVINQVPENNFPLLETNQVQPLSHHLICEWWLFCPYKELLYQPWKSFQLLRVNFACHCVFKSAHICSEQFRWSEYMTECKNPHVPQIFPSQWDASPDPPFWEWEDMQLIKWDHESFHVLAKGRPRLKNDTCPISRRETCKKVSLEYFHSKSF